MRLNPKKIAAAVVVAGILIVALAGNALAAPPWSDAVNAWWVSSYGVTDTQVATVADGYPDGTFRPSNPVTRGQFAKMAVSGLGVAPADPALATFKDVAKGSTFFTFVQGAYDEGLIGGYPVSGGLEFRPGNNITRQQANSILGRYLSQAEITASGVIHGTGTLTYATLALWYAAQGSFYLNGFLDANQVAADHQATTAYLVFHEVVEGSAGKLNPRATLNRAQAAAMVLRVAAEAGEITTPPPAPTGLLVTPSSPGKDSTPQVSGVAIANSPVAVYDTIGGTTTKLTETATNSAGIFYADLTTPLVDGTHHFTAKVKNAAGLVSAASASITYVLDMVAPAGAITAPTVPSGQPDAAVKDAKPTFTATATDERSGVKNVEFQYSVKQTTPSWQSIFVDTTPNTGTTTYSAEWPSSGTLSAGLADGQYLFRAIVTDNADNAITLATVEVTVDTTAPTAQIAPGSLVAQAPTGGVIFYTENRKPLFGATADDAVPAGALASGVTKVDFLYAPITPAPVTWGIFSMISSDPGSSGFAAYSAAGIPPAGMPDGEYLFAVRSTDRAGNESLLMTGNPAAYVAGVTRQVVVDNAAPTIAITAPAEGATIPDATSFAVAWTLVDVSAPTTVTFEYSTDNGVGWSAPVTVPFVPGAVGNYTWPVPDVTGDKAQSLVRITAIDMAGIALGKTGSTDGHYQRVTSGVFTIHDGPVGP